MPGSRLRAAPKGRGRVGALSNDERKSFSDAIFRALDRA